MLENGKFVKMKVNGKKMEENKKIWKNEGELRWLKVWVWKYVECEGEKARKRNLKEIRSASDENKKKGKKLMENDKKLKVKRWLWSL